MRRLRNVRFVISTSLIWRQLSATHASALACLKVASLMCEEIVESAGLSLLSSGAVLPTFISICTITNKIERKTNWNALGFDCTFLYLAFPGKSDRFWLFFLSASFHFARPWSTHPLQLLHDHGLVSLLVLFSIAP